MTKNQTNRRSLLGSKSPSARLSCSGETERPSPEAGSEDEQLWQSDV